MFAAQQSKGKGKGSDGNSRTSYGNNNNNSGNSGDYKPLTQVYVTENGRWNYNSSEKALIVAEWPKLETLANGEAGMEILPAMHMRRVSKLLPYLYLNADAETFETFYTNLKDHATKSNMICTSDDLWTRAGYTIAKPQQSERDQREAKIENEISDLKQAMTNFMNAQAENMKQRPSGSDSSPTFDDAAEESGSPAKKATKPEPKRKVRTSTNKTQIQ
jgi:hypothetical protein